jgi:hypothetical protein
MNRSVLASLSIVLALMSSALAQGIYEESAYYGTRNRGGMDVTRQVQRFARRGEPFRVSNDSSGLTPRSPVRKR